MPSPQEYQAQDEAFSKQYAEQQAQKAQEEAQAKQPPSFMQQWMAPVGRATLKGLDNVVSAADAIYETPGMRKARDVTAGAITGAANMADSVIKFGRAAYATDTESTGDRIGRELSGQSAPAIPTSPVWDHAKQHIMDFRDAVAVKDPDMADPIIQGTAQMMLPWAGYSRVLAGIHGIANFVGAGALVDATASGAHDPRMADVYALGKQTEGKFGEVLRTLAPDGSALNAYINWLHDRTNEGEAEGRFKNVIDGLGTNLIVSPVLTAIGSVLKQGQAGLRYLIDNGVGSGSELASLGKQRGGPGVDPMDAIATKQAQDDMAKAAANPSGKRPPLVQGGEQVQLKGLGEEEHSPDMQAAHDSIGQSNTPARMGVPDVSEEGSLIFRSPNGQLRARTRGDMIQVTANLTKESARGAGEGLQRLADAATYAQETGKKFGSDTKVSLTAAHLYQKLATMGYKVVRNPAELDDKGNLVSTSGRPVFEVQGRSEKGK